MCHRGRSIDGSFARHRRRRRRDAAPLCPTDGRVPYDAFAAGLGDHRVVTTLCPGGKERMRRLMELVQSGRIDLTPLLTHSFALEDIGEAYALFGERQDGVIKVALRP